VKSLSATAGNLWRSPGARRRLQVLAVTFVVLFFALALVSQLPQLLSYNWVLDPGYLALAVVLLILRGPVVVYGWWAVMRVLGYPLPFLTAIRIGYHSALARYLPGQMWYAVSRVYLAERQGVPGVITGVSIGIETALLVVAAGIVSTLSLLVWREAPIWTGLLAVALLLAIVLQPRLLFRALNWGLARIKRQPIEVELSRPQVLRLLGPFVLNWLHYGVMSFALTAALYPALSWDKLPAVTGLYTAAWLIGFLTIFVPQGFFVREGLVFTFLTTLLGIPAPVATAAAVLSRAWTMLSEAVWAAVSTRF
jgi:uncharacterized membrane protein YbhN (UPF0104 family)